ncbi:MAG TPA: hypothetical protein VGK73_09350, partial [Polyangiaceae bacterium]
RPVPLFNTSAGPSPVLDVATLQRQLFDEAEGMNALGLPRAAPPAFLLDAQRLEGHRPSRPGTFDNRWVVFPQDFPSGAKLRAAGIARVVVWQESDGEPKDDLAHVLLRWQEANIEISIKSRAPESRPARTEISRPSWFRSALQRVFVAAGLRPNSAGGFGAPIPMPSSSTYG